MNTLTLGGVTLAASLVGILLGWLASIYLGQRSLARSRQEAAELIHQAQTEAEQTKKAAELTAREQLQKARRRAEQENRECKSQISRLQSSLQTLDRRLESRQDELNRRQDDLSARLEALKEQEAHLTAERAKLEQLAREETVRLEQLSNLSREEARKALLENQRKEARLETARMLRDLREEAQARAQAESQKIMALAIERSASEFSTSRTASTVSLENDKLKGRLIGQDGKNIKAFEAATGMQLIVDETPNQVMISGFHPIKREVARLALEKLVKDGTIHPRRIDDTVRKMRRRTNNIMRRAAEEALRELRIRRVHPEIIKLLGRLRYRTSYGQNVLEHSKEVGYLTGIMAAELGLDEKLARRAGLLHDIGKAIDYEREGTHPEIGCEVARRYGEPAIVVNAIASHHEDCEVISPISVLVAAADALSGARPGARRRTLADYVRRVEKLEGIASSFDGVSESYAIQAGRELRVIAHPDRLSDEESEILAGDIAHRIESEVDYPGRIKVTVIRQLCATGRAR
ncbi:MAG: ribonuclease Y [Acidobacteriota bacterium]